MTHRDGSVSPIRYTAVVEVFTFTPVTITLEYSITGEWLGLWGIHVHGKEFISITVILCVCVNSMPDIWQGINHSSLVR